MSRLSTLTRDIYNRTVLTKRITALTGGLRAVEAVIITNGGTGYTSAPTVGFTGGGGSGAAGTAVVANGVVVSVTMTAYGTGYTSTPTVGFTGGGGSAAAATALMSAETLDAIPTTSVEAGTLALFVIVSSTAYIYALIAGTTAESSPSTIRPDDYAGGTNEKVWRLQAAYASGMTILDGQNIALGTATGTKIGTATSQKLGFFNATPIVQPTMGVATAGATYTSAEQAMLQAVYDAVRNLGLGS